MFRRLDFVERKKQGRYTVRRRAPVGQSLVVIHEPIECPLDHNESCCRLRQFAKRHGTAEIFRHAKQPRDHGGTKKISMRYQGGKNELPAIFPPPEQYGLQLELQLLFLPSDARRISRLTFSAAKRVYRAAQFRFALLR